MILTGEIRSFWSYVSAIATCSTQMQSTVDEDVLSFVATPIILPVYIKYVVEILATCLTFAPVPLFFPCHNINNNNNIT